MTMSTKPRLLCVDDELDLLQGLRLLLRNRYEVSIAQSGAEALEHFEGENQAPFDAVVSDMRMPGMTGAELLTKLRVSHPEVPRLLLTGQADVEATISAINDAKIFRFLTKPCPPELLIESIDEAVEQARFRSIERDLLDRTLNGTVDMLTDVLGLVSTEAADRSHRIRGHVHRLCQEVGIEVMWELDLAAMLCQLGFVAIPAPIGGRESAELHERRVELTAELLIRIPRLQSAAALIRGQLSTEAVRSDNDIAAWSQRELNAEILRLAVNFEELLATGSTPDQAIDAMFEAERPSSTFLLAALVKLHNVDEGHVDMAVGVDDLHPLMILTEDLALTSGPTLAPAGMELTAALISRVVSFARTAGVCEPIGVLVPAQLARQIAAGELAPAVSV